MRKKRKYSFSANGSLSNSFTLPRVLILIASNQRRGAEIEGYQLGIGLGDRGWNAQTLALASVSADIVLDVPVIGKRPLSLMTLWKLRRISREYDVIVAYGSTTLPACAIALFLTRCPFIYRSIGDPRVWLRSELHRARTGFLIRRAKVVVPLWDEAEREIARLYRIPINKINTIPNSRSPIDFPATSQSKRSAAREFFGIGDKEHVVVMVGSLSNEKQVDIGIRSIAEIPGVKLIIVGDGPQRSSLELLAKSSSPNRVIFTGQLENPLAAYQAADCYLLTSATEGMPGTVIEAALCGLPVISPNLGAIPWLFDQGVKGIMLDQPLSSIEVSQALQKILFGLEIKRTELNCGLNTSSNVDLWQNVLLGRCNTTKMRVLHVLDSLEPGGAETSLVAMAPFLEAFGIELHILSLSKRNSLAEKLRDSGASVHVIDHAGSRWHNYSFCRSLIHQLQPNIVHTTLFEADIAGRLAARKERIPSITSIVNDSYSSSHWREAPRIRMIACYLLDVFTIRLATQIHFLTNSTKKTVSRRLFIRKRPSFVLPRGRDLSRFVAAGSNERALLRQNFGINSTSVAVVSVGRQEQQKGFDLLVCASEKICSVNPHVRFFVAGKPGNATKLLEARINRNKNNMTFLGHLQDVETILKAADIFCFPSRREGQGGALLEAVATNRFVIASDIPTNREFLKQFPSNTYKLFRSGDSEDLTNSILSIVNQKRYAKLSNDINQMVRGVLISKYSLPMVSSAMADLYRSVAIDDKHRL